LTWFCETLDPPGRYAHPDGVGNDNPQKLATDVQTHNATAVRDKKIPRLIKPAWGCPFFALKLRHVHNPAPWIATHFFLAAGLLALGSPYGPHLPIPLLENSGIAAAFVPDHSGGPTPDFNGIPY